MAQPKVDLRMSFWSHLDELRNRLVYSVTAIGVGFLLYFKYSEEILRLLLLPMNSTVSSQLSFPFIIFTPNKLVHYFNFTKLTDPNMSHLKIGIITGMMLMIPIIRFRPGNSSHRVIILKPCIFKEKTCLD
jgi:Sec-independent protein secretion pathway component TatC